MYLNVAVVKLALLLEYSAPFNTVDHQIIFDVLENILGISTSSLIWCRAPRVYRHTRATFNARV